MTPLLAMFCTRAASTNMSTHDETDAWGLWVHANMCLNVSTHACIPENKRWIGCCCAHTYGVHQCTKYQYQ